MSDIEWTDTVWNPVLGCSRVSAGCQNCYAERFAHRGLTERHRGLTVMGSKGPRWTGEVRLVPEVLGTPLRWRKPRRVFVNSMSDLFHEGVAFEFIAAVFGVMAAAQQHTFQVLTKRPARAKEFFEWAPSHIEMAGLADESISKAIGMSPQMAGRLYGHFDVDMGHTDVPWPLPNVWLGVSVEDQATANERIPLLLECPAEVRWVSYEPALGAVDFDAWLFDHDPSTADGRCPDCGERPRVLHQAVTCGCCQEGPEPADCEALDWIVVGGESGPGARPFDVEWARSVIRQCAEAGVPAFFKQAGSHPVADGTRLRLRDRKGGDLSELPAEFNVREWPHGVR